MNAIALDAIKTDIFERMIDGKNEIKAQYPKGNLIGRIAEPDEIACSNKSTYVVGQTINVTGGNS